LRLYSYLYDYPTNLTEVQCNAILEIINDNRKRNHSLKDIFLVWKLQKIEQGFWIQPRHKWSDDTVGDDYGQ